MFAASLRRSRLRGLTLIITVLLSAIAGVAHADPGPSIENMSLMARLADGPAIDLAAQGEHVFWGHGGYLEAVNMSDPATPSLVDRVPLSGSVQAIALDGDRAFVATFNTGLYVVDISDPTALQVLGFLPMAADFADICVVPGQVYASVEDYEPGWGLWVIDIGDPANMTIGLRLDDWAANYLLPVGDYVYMSVYHSLRVIHAGDPANPYYLPYDGPYDGGRLCYEGGVLYTTYRGIYVDGYDDYPTEGVRSYSIGDPENPTLLGTWEQIDVFGSGVSGIAASNGLVYARIYEDLVVLDFSNPSSPTLAGQVAATYDIENLMYLDGHVHIVDETDGLASYSVPTTPPGGDPVAVGALDSGPTYFAKDFTRDGDLAVVANFTGISALDMSDPAAPTWIVQDPSADDLGNVREVTLADGLLCYDSNDYDLYFADLDDPASPQLYPGEINENHRTPLLVGDMLYGCFYHLDVQWSWNVYAYDLSQPITPVMADEYVTPYKTFLCREGDVIFAYSEDHSLKALDISTPGDINWLGEITVDWDTSSGGSYEPLVCVADGILLVWDGRPAQSEVQVIDVSTPGNMVQRGRYTDGIYPTALAMAPGCGYLADVTGRVQMLSVEDPDNPAITGHCVTGSRVIGLSAEGALVHAMTYDAGLYVLRNDALATASPDDLAPATQRLASHPNPFNPRTTIHFALTEAGPVSLEIFDIQGRRVRSLLRGRRDAGDHRLEWDGRNDEGGELASGVYLAQLKTREDERRIKLALIR